MQGGEPVLALLLLRPSLVARRDQIEPPAAPPHQPSRHVTLALRPLPPHPHCCSRPPFPCRSGSQASATMVASPSAAAARRTQSRARAMRVRCSTASAAATPFTQRAQTPRRGAASAASLRRAWCAPSRSRFVQCLSSCVCAARGVCPGQCQRSAGVPSRGVAICAAAQRRSGLLDRSACALLLHCSVASRPCVYARVTLSQV